MSLMAATLMIASSAATNAQLRIDAGARVGHSTISYSEGLQSKCPLLNTNKCAFSWGVEAKVGYEFKHGLGISSGLNYDMIRFYTSHLVFERRYDEESGMWVGDGHEEGNYLHSYGFLTIPLRFEYRCLNDIVRPYVGYGCSFLIRRYDGFFTEQGETRWPVKFEHKSVVPVFMFGVDLEYKRFIVGFGRRKDQSIFMEERQSSDSSWKSSQNTFKIGYRLF